MNGSLLEPLKSHRLACSHFLASTSLTCSREWSRETAPTPQHIMILKTTTYTACLFSLLRLLLATATRRVIGGRKYRRSPFCSFSAVSPFCHLRCVVRHFSVLWIDSMVMSSQCVPGLLEEERILERKGKNIKQSTTIRQLNTTGLLQKHHLCSTLIPSW